MRANYNPRKEHSIRKRYGFKNPKKSFLIICEGENTEPDYFNAFRLTSAIVKAVGKGLGTMNLVKEAIIIRDREKNMGKSFDYCWVVFDKDDYQDFDESISYAENNGFNVAYSNESFELWFLLHFSLFVNPVARGNYARLLSKYLGIPYTKQSGFAKKLYQILKPLESKAIKNAETLMVGHNGMKPSEANPSTTVHKLVSSLNEYVD